MTFLGAPKTEEERRERRRFMYEWDKKDIVDYFKSQGLSTENLAECITNSMLRSGYEKELFEDGYITAAELEEFESADEERRNELIARRIELAKKK